MRAQRREFLLVGVIALDMGEKRHVIAVAPAAVHAPKEALEPAGERAVPAQGGGAVNSVPIPLRGRRSHLATTDPGRRVPTPCA